MTDKTVSHAIERGIDFLFANRLFGDTSGWSGPGVDPSVETRKTGTDFVSLLSSVQQQDCARSLLWPAKRTRALLESNPRRNNRRKTHRNDGRPGRPNSLFGFFWFIGLIDPPMP